jgi:tetratricopeptide (TPR) repeat protein
MTAQPFKTLVLDLVRQSQLDEEALWQELNETERTAVGTPLLWSARDHLTHRNFWHQNLIHNLTAIQHHQQVPPREESDDQINAKVFEENRLRPWSALYAESQQIYAQLIQITEQLSEDDLTDSHRFAAISREHPLYTTFLGSFYEHDQEHFAQYYLDRHDVARAIQIRENCASRIMQTEVPAWVKGYFVYNLACFYAKLNQLEKAAALLQESLALTPDLTESSKSDPDLEALRNQSV